MVTINNGNIITKYDSTNSRKYISKNLNLPKSVNKKLQNKILRLLIILTKVMYLYTTLKYYSSMSLNDYSNLYKQILSCNQTLGSMIDNNIKYYSGINDNLASNLFNVLLPFLVTIYIKHMVINRKLTVGKNNIKSLPTILKSFSQEEIIPILISGKIPKTSIGALNMFMKPLLGMPSNVHHFRIILEGLIHQTCASIAWSLLYDGIEITKIGVLLNKCLQISYKESKNQLDQLNNK